MNIPQLTALCLRYQGSLAGCQRRSGSCCGGRCPSHELLDALHFATTKRIEITCWTRQQMEGHASRTQQTLPVAVQEKHQPKAELLARTLQSALEQRASDIHIEPADNAYRIRLRIDGVLHPLPDVSPDAGVALTARLKCWEARILRNIACRRTGNSLSNWQETPSHFVLRPYHVGVVKRWY